MNQSDSVGPASIAIRLVRHNPTLDAVVQLRLGDDVLVQLESRAARKLGLELMKAAEEAEDDNN